MATETTTDAPFAPRNRSQDFAQLVAALAKAQGEFGSIARTRTVKVRTQAGQEYTFNYAPLDEVLAAVRPALAKNGLAVTQILSGGGGDGTWMRTLLTHESGEWIASDMEVTSGRPGKAQELGSLITYMRRYSLVALLGVASEEDDDGNAGDGNHREGRDREPRGPKGGGTGGKSSTSSTTSPNGTQSPPTGSPPASSASTPPGTKGAPDPEHAKTLQSVRDIVGKQLKLEAKDAKARMVALFGVASSDALTKTQAATFLQLLIAETTSAKHYDEALAKAREQGLVLPAQGAAA